MPAIPPTAESTSELKTIDPGNTLTIDQFETLLDAIAKANATEGRRRKRLCEAQTQAEEPVGVTR